MTTIRQLGEFELIQRLRRRLASRSAKPASVVAGIGDDCAVLRGGDPRKLLLYTCDPVVENVHFKPTTPPRQVGWKAMARNLSDIAAMGGLPRWAVVSLGLRPATPLRYVERVYDGLRAAAEPFGCTIVGGDTTHVRHEQFIVVSLIGEVEKRHLTRRAGSKSGDRVFVTGTLGGSRRGKHLTFIPRVAEARWLVGHFRVHAMIDLSDGLSSDLRRLAEAGNKRLGFDISAGAVPISAAAHGNLQAALSDGEDFELLFTIAARDAAGLRAKWRRRFNLPLTEIGRVTPSNGRICLVTADGRRRPLPAAGYDHFA
jgi:thiamine-monophosphate kinase